MTLLDDDDSSQLDHWRFGPPDPPDPPCRHVAVEVICVGCGEHLGLMANE